MRNLETRTKKTVHNRKRSRNISDHRRISAHPSPCPKRMNYIQTLNADIVGVNSQYISLPFTCS